MQSANPAHAPPAPGRECRFCPRLAAFLDVQRKAHPGWHNAPVNGFGAIDAPILMVGLAPGLRGANRTGRPFTGDYAGDLLYATLKKYGLATGDYDCRPDDGFTLTKIRIVNAVRCVPPENKPIAAEINTCRQFLVEDMAAMKNIRVIITLGGIAHASALKALGLRRGDYPFGHGAEYELPRRQGGETAREPQIIMPRHLIASYHCSRYNTNTGRLTEQMFEAVFARASALAGVK